jgi:phage head maturation protease
MSIRKVYEVSAVAFPAYPQTDIQAASEGESLESVRASLESAKQKLAEERAAQAEAERRRAVLERLDAEKERRRVVLEQLNYLMKEVKRDEV